MDAPLDQSEHVFIEQRKVLRLACYRAHKYGKKIAEVCPFKFTRIQPDCKNCVWFKILDETKTIKALLKEEELDATKEITLRLGDLPRPTLDDLRNA